MTEVKVKKILGQLLRDPENSYCADCKTATNPRWSSWSLGVFICIKCAGTHRSLGTHISKVKSVDLDSWEMCHLEKLIYYKNNKIANCYYEGELKNNTGNNNDTNGKYVPNQSQLSSFIRTKYEMKKWCNKDANIKELIAESNSSNNSKGNALRSSSATTTTKNSASLTGSSGNLTENQNKSDSNLVDSLLDLNLSALPSNVSLRSIVSSTPPVSSTPQPAVSTKNNTTNDRPELKKSILSLYAKPASSSNSFASSSNSNKVQSGMPKFSTASSNSLNPSFNTTLNGLTNNNVKSDSSLSLEDNDLFKNVWS